MTYPPSISMSTVLGFTSAKARLYLRQTAMRPKILAIIAAILFGLIYLQAPSAGTRSPDLRAELVVVLNMNRANPLGGEIWLMDLKGRLVRRITKNNYHEESPKFSPDGNKIVFVRNMGGIVPGVGLDPKYNEIFVYNLRTGVESRLTKNNVEDGHPEWSFDGKYIAFHSRRNHPEGKATLWIMEADGSRARQITGFQSGDISHLDPSWGPDGQWLAFVNYREENRYRYSRIEKIRIDGTQRTVLSSGGKFAGSSGAEKGEPLGDMDPIHSPDGAMIWSARRLNDGLIHLFVFGANTYYGGKAETDMNWPVHPDAVERSPQFSPDGRRILLTRSSPKAGVRNRQLVLTDPQSSFRRYLTAREDWDMWHPSWHPFAQSAAEKESNGTLMSYKAGNAVGVKTILAHNGDGRSAAQRLKTAGAVRLTVSAVQPVNLKSAPPAAYEVGWKLDVAPERVSSLTVRYQGRLHGEDEVGEKSLLLQLMDWGEKSWVTVFVLPEASGDRVKIQHEIAPAHFISGDKHEVKLRIVAFGASIPALEMDSLTLDVRRN